MREQKFKVWNTLHKHMTKPLTIQEMVMFSPHPNSTNENCLYLEYTGLKDKNGKEIYEDDIIRIDWSDKDGNTPTWRPNDSGEIHKVHYWMGCPLYYSYIATGDCHVKYLHELFRNLFIGLACEVIGNIHENPKLLK